LSNRAWAIIQPLLAQTPGPGRPRTVDLRAIVNAIFSINRTGAQWRLLPKDFPLESRLLLLPHVVARWDLAPDQ
jgi:putative transposase